MAFALRTVIAGLMLLGLAFVWPGHFDPWVSYHQQWVAALGLWVLVLGIVLGHRGPPHGWPWPAWLAMVLATVAPLQFAAGQIDYRSDAVLPPLYLLGVAAGLAAAQQWRLGPAGVDATALLLKALLAAAVGSTCLAVAQWVDVGVLDIFMINLPPGGRPFGNLGQVNHHATLLTLGMVALWCLYEQGELRAWVAALAAAWLGWGLAMAQSRTSWLNLLVLAAAWVLMRRRLSIGTPLPAVFRTPLPAVAGWLAFVAGATVAWKPLSGALRLAPPDALAERMAAGPRTEIWSAMADAVLRSPWTGYGWNQVARAQMAVAGDRDASHRLLHSAHSVLLDMPLWFGIPLALVIVGLAGLWLWRRARACASAEQLALLGGLACLLVHGLLEYPLEYTYFLFPAALMAGLLHGAQRVPTGPSVAPPVVAALLAGSFALLVWIEHEYLRLEASSQTVRYAAVGLEPVQAGLDSIPDILLLDAPRDQLVHMLAPTRAGMAPAELQAMARAAQRYPTSSTLMRLAAAQQKNGQPGDADLTVRRLCSIHLPPRCREARTLLLQLRGPTGAPPGQTTR
ncbi:PglL family O-oligosaccharyltransferase [Ideonella sp. A 288]|uniref:PglL family O-oligosaccharyltransferase n=1 Tax=Ideonella sp. A 288 TaxID=1962181 RepID=UPI000B4BEE05|nr:O-antigen ligase family protein [Ideonella sp. A 288]